MSVIRLDHVTDALKARGVPAYTEQTGGGVATIYAGPRWEEDGWGYRYAALCGPGWFQDSHFTNPHADTGDLNVGADNEDGGDYIRVPESATWEQIVDLIVAYVAVQVAINPLAAAGDTTWAGDLDLFRSDLIRSHTS
jgi:hypothetical protein